jgi:anti-sigma factor RsiW
LIDMGCEEIRDLLALYAGGESYDHEKTAVEAHVAVCAACARELDHFREARANLALLREGTPPAGTFKTLWTNVRAELFPRKAAPRFAWVDDVLRYAAVTMVGIAIGVLIHYADRRDAPVASAPDAAMAPTTVGAPVTHATMEERSIPRFFLRPRPLPAAPPAEFDGNFYLPRVESLPAGAAKDF